MHRGISASVTILNSRLTQSFYDDSNGGVRHCIVGYQLM